MKRTVIRLAVLLLGVSVASCALGPDRWTVYTERDWDARTGQSTQQKLGASLSGPIPTFADAPAHH